MSASNYVDVRMFQTGDVLVADTHGNHLHVVMFPAGEDSRNSQQFHHSEFKVCFIRYIFV